jgi:cellulose synthase/poly-beta-1,6-N-acetylglucosamine synthase-like glycosyltransferase
MVKCGLTNCAAGAGAFEYRHVCASRCRFVRWSNCVFKLELQELNLIQVLLIASASFLVLLYSVYGVLLLYWSKREPRVERNENLCSVSILVCTYNEEKVIEQKIRNLLKLDYPKEKLEILFVDSGSTDRTREIITNYVDGRTIRLETQEERLGQNSAENYVIPRLRGEIVVTTDAEVSFDRGALRELVKNFADPSIGGVTGRLVTLTPNKFPERIEGTYKELQNFMLSAEARADSTFIVAGQLFAFRRELFRPLDPAKGADDASTALAIRRQGYRVVFESEAVFFEYAADNFSERTEQKVKRAAVLIESIVQFRDMVLNPRYGKFGLVILPAQFGMLICSPVLLLLASALVLYLSLVDGVVLTVLAACLVTFFAISVVSRRFLRVVASFVHSQYALCVALKRVLTSRNQNVMWKKVYSTRKPMQP